MQLVLVFRFKYKEICMILTNRSIDHTVKLNLPHLNKV